MKGNTYIKSGDFFIRDNLAAYMLYFDYFIAPNLPLAKFIKKRILRKIAYLLLRLAIIVLFILKTYRLKYKILKIDDGAILLFKGSGKWSNKIRLYKKNGKLLIEKTVFSKDVFIKEKNFYLKYKKRESIIVLPKCQFIAPLTIEMEFVHASSFSKSIVDGTLNFNEAIKLFQTIKNEINSFYGQNPTLIHGDLWPTNIFIGNMKYFFIDFSESFFSSFHYDLYVLLYGILVSFAYISAHEKSILRFSHDGVSALDLLGVSLEEFKKIELTFRRYRKKRFS